MQSSKYYKTMFHLKKEFTKSNLVLYLSFILITWSLLQISLTDFFENNDNILMKVPSIYAQDDDGGNDNGEVSDDNGDSDVEELSQDEDVGQEDFPEEQTVEDSHDEGIDISRFSGGGPSGTDITSQLTPVNPLPLPVNLPLPPAGPLPPGGLPPIPGSPLPPGSPIPPGGGPTPPEDLPPLLGDLPPHDGYHDDDDDENEEDDDGEKEEEDEDNDDKDNS